MPTTTGYGHLYFQLIVDDYSSHIWIQLMRSKAEAGELFQGLNKKLSNLKSPEKLVFVRTDGGTEYLAKTFKTYLNDFGIKHEVSTAYNQWQNGLVERAMGLVSGRGKANLTHSGSSVKNWGFSFTHAVQGLNDSETSRLPTGVTREMAWNNIMDPELRFSYKNRKETPHPWGCLAYAKIYVGGKLAPNAEECVYLGKTD